MKGLRALFLMGLLSAIMVFGCSRGKSEVKEIDLTQAKREVATAGLEKPKLYVAIAAMISPSETFNLYESLIHYVSKKLGIPIEFKQRKTYQEVNELLERKQIDFAFICTGGYLQARKTFPVELLTIPVVENQPYYRALIIVRKGSGITRFDQLRGKSFAFTDPLSNTGYDYVYKILEKERTTPEQYFSKVIFTYAHDNSIQAVSRGLVDGASVDKLVYDFLLKSMPARVSNVEVIQESQRFGNPPFVVRPDLPDTLKDRLREVFLNMDRDPEGKEILRKIMIDRFIRGNNSLYERN